MTLSLVKSLTSFDMIELDEMAYSAISEISNIISGNASQLISAGGKKSDIKAPQLINKYEETENRKGFYIDTALGRLAISVNVK
jgi:CheY-specific phosphatase CheX